MDTLTSKGFLPCESDADLSISEPTAIELLSKYDYLFKQIVSSGWANESSGNVEATVGYFAKAEVPAHDGEREEMRDAVCLSQADIDLFAELESGWYLTVENSDGIIWVWFDSRENVEKAFEYLTQEYLAWADDEPGMEGDPL